MRVNTPITRLVTWIAKLIFSSRADLSHAYAFIHNNSFKKFINFIHSEFEKRIKRSVIKSKPYIMFLEVNNICNLKCPFCMTGKGIYGGRQKRDMTLDEVKKLIDQVGDYLYLIQLYNWGEPLLNKDLFKMIEYIKSKNIFTMVSSNMTTLDEAKIDEMIKSGLDYFKVAIDGATKESYTKYRIGGDFAKVMDNFKTLMRRRAELKSGLPIVEWQYVVFKHNEGELEMARKIAKELGVDYFNARLGYIEDKDWIPETKKYKADVFNPNLVKKCRRLWSHLNVRCDGGIAPCCFEFFKKDDFANIFDTSFDEIWNNEIFKYSRELCLDPSLVKEGIKLDTICFNCIRSQKVPSLNIDELEKQEKLMKDKREE